MGERELCLVRPQRQPERLAGGRVVAQLRVLEQPVDGIHAVAGGAALEPEAQHVLHGGDHLGVAPVQVRLLGVERVQVPAPVERAPGRSAEGRGPVVGLVGPDVPVRVLAEPGVLDGGVTGDQIEQHVDPALARGDHQRIEVTQGAERRVDTLVVGNVVAEVVHRRGIEGRDPQGVDPEPTQVVEPRLDPGKIPDSVAVGILERARIDLVDDGVRSHRPARLEHAWRALLMRRRVATTGRSAGPAPRGGPPRSPRRACRRRRAGRRACGSSPARCRRAPPRRPTFRRRS